MQKEEKNREVEGFIEQDGKYAVFVGNKHHFTFIPERHANAICENSEKKTNNGGILSYPYTELLLKTENVQILNDCEAELVEIKTWATDNPLDSKLRYLNAYAVVRSSGAIEMSLKKMICDWLSENAKSDARTYLEKMIVDSSSNPSTGIMLRFLQDFNQEKKRRFESVAGSNLQDKSNLNSLVQWRNDIAHGRSISQGINTIYNDFLSGKMLLEKFYDILTDASV